MPHNVGAMFYTGAVPWHGLGVAVAKPVTVDEALRCGGLEWEVGSVPLVTDEDPSSPVSRRHAIVRLDRQPGDPGRVLSVTHLGFKPLQNREGAMLFDVIFGQGRPVYYTGGYLLNGEVVWLLARLDAAIEVAPDDEVHAYALYANSHDGSVAIHMRLTTVRVVCQNTLSLALGKDELGVAFRRAHQGSLRDHAAAAQAYFARTVERFRTVGMQFRALTLRLCDDAKAREIVGMLLPMPVKPRGADEHPAVHARWEKECDRVRQARRRILQLRETGRGAGLNGARGTFWGLLNAVLEFVDHDDPKTVESGPGYALLGRGMELKRRAFETIQQAAA